MESFYNLGGPCHSMERTDHTFALLGRITVGALPIPYWDLVLTGKRAFPQVALVPVRLTSLTSHRHMFKVCFPPLIPFCPTHTSSVSGNKPVKAVWLPAAQCCSAPFAHETVQTPAFDTTQFSCMYMTQHCFSAASNPTMISSCYWTKFQQSTWPDIHLNIFIYKKKSELLH